MRAPEELARTRAASIINMNPNYLDENREMLRRMALTLPMEQA